MSTTIDQCTCGAKFLPDDAFCGVCGAGRPVAPKPVRSAVADPIRNQLAASTKGRYEILAQLGRGGFGAVYLANDSILGRRVAIKVLSSHLDVDSTVERFYREARTQAALAHPNVVAVYGVDDTSELPHFTMQYIPGRSLQQLLLDHLGEKKLLSLGAVQALVYQIGEALNFAHSRGVIHRDVKAGNILLDENGNAVVTDFGIAKVVDDVMGTWTELGVGTPAYMSPEQIKRSPITPASDQYSLGVLVHELLTGLPPFAGSSYELHHAHLNTAPPSVRERRPECSKKLAEALRRMLAKRPSDRFPHLRDALMALGARPVGLGDDAVRRELIAAADVAGTDERLRAKASRKTEAGARSSGSPPLGAEQLISTLTLDRNAVEFAVGDECELRVVARALDGSVVESMPVEWSSSNPHVLAVTSTSGVSVRARGVAVGSGTISATVSGASAACAVTVKMPVAEEYVATVIPSYEEVGQSELRATEVEVVEVPRPQERVEGATPTPEPVTTTVRWRVKGDDGSDEGRAPNDAPPPRWPSRPEWRRVLSGGVAAAALAALAVSMPYVTGGGGRERDSSVRGLLDAASAGSTRRETPPVVARPSDGVVREPNVAEFRTDSVVSRGGEASVRKGADARGRRPGDGAPIPKVSQETTPLTPSEPVKVSTIDSVTMAKADAAPSATSSGRDSSVVHAAESPNPPSLALLAGEAGRVCGVLSSRDAVQLARLVNAADASGGGLTSDFIRWWQEYAPSAKMKDGSLLLSERGSEASFQVELTWKNSGGRKVTRVAAFVATIVRSGEGHMLQSVRPVVRFW